MKTKNILVFLLCLFMLALVSCTDTTQENNDNKKQEEIKEQINLVFNDSSFSYDGLPHSIFVSGFPFNYSVEYENNEKVEVGNYSVTATVKNELGEVYKVLSALLRITACTHEDNNVDNICDKCNSIINVIDVSGVTLSDASFTYDGLDHEIVCSNIPQFITVTYEANIQKEVGEYNVKASLFDALGNLVKELTCKLTILECTEHVDLDEDNRCDICGTTVITPCSVHTDLDSDLKCDICHEQLEKRFHINDDGNDFCDRCGARLIESINGIYLLESRTANGYDTSDEVYAEYLELCDNVVKWYKIDYTKTDINEGSYMYNDGNVNMTFGIYEYSFSYDKTNHSLDFNGRMNKKDVEMEFKLGDYVVDANDKGEVAFTDQLFGDDINENFYNYCPSIMYEGKNVMHIYYCSNLESGKVVDHIAYRKGVLHADMKWVFSEKKIVLSPTLNNGVHKATQSIWDSMHCCDPSVIKGKFSFNGETYNYLMAYLGCWTGDCTCNEIGFAVSKTPGGDWIKVQGSSQAFISYYNSEDFGADGSKYWGYGQPSLISVDNEGVVLVFFTKGIKLGTYSFVQKWDFSNINNPVLLKEAILPNGPGNMIVNNADFAYDERTNTIYCLCEDHTTSWAPSSGGVDWLVGGNLLFSYKLNDNDINKFDSLFNNFSWQKCGSVDKSVTGFERNHNCGIVTDEYGNIMNSNCIPIVYTMSMLKTDYPNWNLGGQWPALHTYRLYGYVIELE